MGVIGTLTRLGLLAATISMAVSSAMAGAVLTTLLLAGYGAYTALAGRPVFGTWLEGWGFGRSGVRRCRERTPASAP